MTTTFDEAKCKSCGSDWAELERDLNTPLDNGIYYARSLVIRLRAKGLIEKCDECKKHFGKED